MAEKIHDKGYKRILSRRAIFMQLLQRFVNTSWLKDVQESDLQLVDKEFIPSDFQEREADIVYKLNQDGNEYYLYVLLELQSSVDYTMPFRLLIYMTELMKRVFEDTDQKERERKDFRMPPVIPIVLYNGVSPWTAAQNFQDYCRKGKSFGKQLISFEYYLIDINAQDAETLSEMDTLLSNIFLLDKSRNREELERALKTISRRLQRLTQDEQRELMDWIRDVLMKKATKVMDERAIEQTVSDWMKGDERSMTSAMERIIDDERNAALLEGRKEGEEEGKREGRREGEKEGKRDVALKLIRMKMDVEQIIEATGLSREELKALEENQK